MKKDEAVKKAGKKNKRIVESYTDADSHVWINTDDPDLIPIKIEMPEPPDWSEIEGYGLPAKDQFFRRQRYPKKLKLLERKIRSELEDAFPKEAKSSRDQRLPERMISYLEQHTHDYVDEIDWLKRQWYYRVNGYWFFNNGKPTYMTGWNWSFLNYCKLISVAENDGLPEFRIRDMKWFHAAWYLYNDTKVPKKDEDGELLFNDDGTLQLEDVGYYTCIGMNSLKGRRVGDTTKALWIAHEIATTLPEQHCGMQGDADTTASENYTKRFLYPLDRTPWFFKPKMKKTKDNVLFQDKDGDGLGSWVDYATTAHRSFYDSTALQFYHGDELGKTKSEDVVERHDTVKLCVLPPGGNRVGFIMNTTTVEYIGDSANKFKELTFGSMYEDREDIGFTSTGLVNVFFKAEESAKGFIDKYGYPIIDTPTEEQLKNIKHPKQVNGRYVGAREYFESTREEPRRKGDFQKLASIKRKNPQSFRECFTPPAENTFWDIAILEQRKQYLELDNPSEQAIRGDFLWERGPKSRVMFKESPNGRFYVSKVLKDHETNMVRRMNGTYMPMNVGKFVSSADPFKVDKTNGNRFSDGGGATRWMYDESVDDGVEMSNWRSATPVCTYEYRPPSRDEYVDDMLKMCWYYGSMMYPENNVSYLIDKFIEWDCRGFLLYDFDGQAGKMKNNAGFSSQTGSKNDLFTLFADDIKKHGHRYKDMGLINDCLEMKSFDDMTKYDRWTAVAGTLKAEDTLRSQDLAFHRNQKDDMAFFAKKKRRK